MVKSLIKRIIVGFLFIFTFSLFLPKNTYATNSTLTPNRMSFQTGGGSPISGLPVSAYSYASFPYMTFYGYTSISDNTWNYAGWIFWSRITGDYDLSFMYEGAWNTNSNDALSFSISQGSTVYPCSNTAISVNNGRANRSIISVYCPNVSLSPTDFTINLNIPTAKVLTGSEIGITPLNLYDKGTTTMHQILTQQQKQLEEQKKTNDTLNDSTTDDPSSDINSMNGKLASNGSITQLLTLPIQMYQNILNSVSGSCSSFSLGSLYNHDLTLPCINLKNLLGSTLYGIIDILISGLFILSFRKKMVDIFNHMTSLNDRGNEVE